MHFKELAPRELSIVAKNKLARTFRQETVLEDKFGGLGEDEILTQTKNVFALVIHNATSYLSDPSEVERIRKVVKERYYRLSRAQR